MKLVDVTGTLDVYSYRSAKVRTKANTPETRTRIDRSSALVRAIESMLYNQNLMGNHIVVVCRKSDTVWFFHDMYVYLYDLHDVDIVEEKW